MIEAWDRVTGALVGTYDSEEEAEADLAPYEKDFVLIEVDE